MANVGHAHESQPLWNVASIENLLILEQVWERKIGLCVSVCVSLRARVSLSLQKEKMEFKLIFSNDKDELRSIIEKITAVWNTKSAHGTMRND